MLRVADRGARWAKWRAMASGMLDQSKLGRAFTVRNVGAAGTLVAAVGAGVLASRYLAESQKREEALRLDLNAGIDSLRLMLEEHHAKVHALLDASKGGRKLKNPMEQKKPARRSLAIIQNEEGSLSSAHSGSDEGVLSDASRKDANAAAERIMNAVMLTVEASKAGRSASPGATPVDVESALLMLQLAELIGITDTLEESVNIATSAVGVRALDPQVLDEALAALTPAPSLRFGSAPLVLTLGRALSAVSVPDRPEIARQMARVILAMAALAAHRETTETGRVTDLYTSAD
jgi:hypothetical protein